MIMRRSGFLRGALQVTTHIENLLTLIGSTVLAGRVRHKRSLAGGAQANVLGLHRVVRAAASDAGSGVSTCWYWHRKIGWGITGAMVTGSGITVNPR